MIGQYLHGWMNRRSVLGRWKSGFAKEGRAPCCIFHYVTYEYMMYIYSSMCVSQIGWLGHAACGSRGHDDHVCEDELASTTERVSYQVLTSKNG